MNKTERGRFELPIPCGIHAFQACALGLYATSPLYYFIKFSLKNQGPLSAPFLLSQQIYLFILMC